MPDSIPAIVDKDLFEEVQQKIKKNSRAPARHKAEDDYLLTTKLFCGMCGAMMFGECGTGRNKVVHHYYKCATAKRFKTCKKKTVRKEWLEDLVVAETMKLIPIVAEALPLTPMKSLTVWHGHSTRPSLPAGTARKVNGSLPRGRQSRLISCQTKNRKFPLAGYP